jgi:hypothetical protein
MILMYLSGRYLLVNPSIKIIFTHQQTDSPLAHTEDSVLLIPKPAIEHVPEPVPSTRRFHNLFPRDQF